MDFRIITLNALRLIYLIQIATPILSRRSPLLLEGSLIRVERR
ncbi:MAG: hypothetical protein QXT49_02285 [Candidatus Nezhaarchaeales archaeon]